MKFPNPIPVILLGAATVMVQSQVLAILNGTEINDIAKETTVLLDGQNSGSGVIVGKQAETYYVLTAQHVVATEDEYTVVTPDTQEKHPVNYSMVQKLPDVDLAVIPFTSRQSYRVAELGNSNTLTEGDTVFISGWPHAGRSIPHLYQFTTGQISGIPPRVLMGGYGLIYTNVTRAGMSGGPIFNESGELIGIHGQAEGREIYLPNYETEVLKSGFNLGIPVNTFLAIAPQTGINLEGFPEPVSEPVLSDDKPVAFANALRLVDASTPNNLAKLPGTYYFTINLPDNAAQPLQQVTLAQVEGTEYPRFNVKKSKAFAGTRKQRGAELPVDMVVTDPPSRTVTVTFDPPVSPGQVLTIALRTVRNPRDGIYLYRVTAFPEGGESARGQIVGTGRFQFYRLR